MTPSDVTAISHVEVVGEQIKNAHTSASPLREKDLPVPWRCTTDGDSHVAKGRAMPFWRLCCGLKSNCRTLATDWCVGAKHAYMPC